METLRKAREIHSLATCQVDKDVSVLCLTATSQRRCAATSAVPTEAAWAAATRVRRRAAEARCLVNLEFLGLITTNEEVQRVTIP